MNKSYTKIKQLSVVFSSQFKLKMKRKKKNKKKCKNVTMENNTKFRCPRISCNMKYLLDIYFQANKKYSHLIICYPICLEARTFIVRGFHGSYMLK